MKRLGVSLPSGCGDDAVSRVDEGWARREGTGRTGPRASKGWRSHRPLTNVGNNSERGPECKDTP